MKWLAIVGIVAAMLVLLAGVVALIGARLPVQHVASREARLTAAPGAVWQAITDVERDAARQPGGDTSTTSPFAVSFTS